jgi:hypothetical protein
MTNLNAYPILNCPDGKPVTAYAYQPGAASPTNTGNLDIVCEEDRGFAPCNTMPGLNALNDNIVAISTDWGNAGIVGCPNGRVMIVLQCNDGSGALLSVDGSCAFLGYNPEAAYPFDGTSASFNAADLPSPAPPKNGRPRILGFTRTGGMDVFDVQVDLPAVQSDCLPGTYGQLFVSLGYCSFNCPNNDIPNLPSRGRLYSSTQSCSTTTDTRPSNKARASWTMQTLDAVGHAMVTLQTPTAGMCNFLGTSTLVGTSESDLITGFVVAGDPNAASPVAERVRATRKGNSVEVAFSTSSELGLAGFNVYAAGKAKGEIKLNAGLVSAKGVGGAGASYSLSYAMGEFKGHRGIIVESVMTDGSTLRAPKVDF